MALQQTCIREPRPNHSLAEQQPASSHGENVRALPVLTAESEQTKASLELDDTKHLEDTNMHAATEAESVKKIADVINNQLTHPLKCEEQELVKISTGH